MLSSGWCKGLLIFCGIIAALDVIFVATVFVSVATFVVAVINMRWRKRNLIMNM